MFPVEVSCPKCGESLMDQEHPIEGFPSIRVVVEHEETEGDLWLSSIYGSYRGKQILDVPRGTEIRVFCPHCEEELSDLPACSACGANTVTLEMPHGGIVRFCSRFGCRKHSIAFGDLGEVVVASIMNRYIVSVYESDSLLTAAETLINYEISAVPVLDDSEQVMGLITEDVILNLAYPEIQGDGVSPGGIPTVDEWHSEPCGKYAVKNPEAIAPDARLPEAAAKIMETRRNLLLVQKRGTLVGVLSRGDLFRALLREKLG